MHDEIYAEPDYDLSAGNDSGNGIRGRRQMYGT